MSDEEIIALALAAGFEQEEICLSGNGESDRRLTVGEYPICDAVMALVRPIIDRAEKAEAERDDARRSLGLIQRRAAGLAADMAALRRQIEQHNREWPEAQIDMPEDTP